MPSNCQISLVIPTKGRSEELRRLLLSLAVQTGVMFEAIVVDQNPDDRLVPVLVGPWPFALRHMHCPADSGASRGRNVGWRQARAAILLFPDDDAWYPPDFLARGLALMAARGADILTGRSTDEGGRTINGRYAPRAGPIPRHGIWTRQIEWISFFRRDVLETVNGYDETIGVGAATPWQAAEGPDLIVRAIDAGAATWYDPALIAFHHELPTHRPDAAMVSKGRAYGRGMGRVLRQRGFGVGGLIYWAGRALAAMLCSAVKLDGRRVRYCRAVLLGRVEGYVGRISSGSEIVLPL